MSQDCRQSPKKALLNTFGTCHKTDIMETSYRSHDTEDIPAIQDSAPLDIVPLEHPMPEGDNESSDEYCEETNTCCPLAELLEQFWQVKDWFTSLKSTTPQSTPTTELTKLTDKLQHLTMMLQPHLAPQSSKEPVENTMQVYTDILQATQRELKLTITMLQDIPLFDGQDSSKLEDWFMDINCCWHSNRATHAWLRPNHVAPPACSSARLPKQESAVMKSRASSDWKSVM